MTSTVRRHRADDARLTRLRLAITGTGHQEEAGPAGQDIPRGPASGHGHGGRVAQEGK
ncbi:hypothetical protein [Streptomyces chartreusis]|uniref:hypothetical protein n=1 Tax=Streptomyces chartreusis TaxID=1969 RepID=UPI002E16C12B